MSTEQLALLKSIICNPKEDTPRLVYADAIEEEQPERAEFIRVQVALAKIPNSKYNPGMDCKCRCCVLLRRERGLHKAISCTHGLPLNRVEITWIRGFISHITCTVKDWVKYERLLYWDKEQTVECQECEGDGTVGWFTGKFFPCKNCTGTGRVPRPCSPTAQPIEKVILTTLPGERLDYPGVEFVLAVMGEVDVV